MKLNYNNLFDQVIKASILTRKESKRLDRLLAAHNKRKKRINDNENDISRQ